MRYFLYARKSTDVEDKQILSIDAQLAELQALAKQERLNGLRYSLLIQGCAGLDREYAFLPQLETSPSLGFGRVRDSRPVVLDRYPLRLFESFTHASQACTTGTSEFLTRSAPKKL